MMIKNCLKKKKKSYPEIATMITVQSLGLLVPWILHACLFSPP